MIDLARATPTYMSSLKKALGPDMLVGMLPT